MFYAFDPAFLRSFKAELEKACESPAGWARMHGLLSRLSQPPRVRFSVAAAGPWYLIAPNDEGVDLTADAIPNADQKKALLKKFAKSYPACQFSPIESKFFPQVAGFEDQHPELGLSGSAEWDLLRGRIFAPEYWPEEFAFLEGNRDNTTASCVTDAEAREIVERERAEHLLEHGLIGVGTDSLAILALLQLAAAKRWYVWLDEVS